MAGHTKVGCAVLSRPTGGVASLPVVSLSCGFELSVSPSSPPSASVSCVSVSSAAVSSALVTSVLSSAPFPLLPSPPVIPPAPSAALSSVLLPPVSSAVGPLAVLVSSLVPETVSTLVSSVGTELVLPQPATKAAAMVVASSRFFTIVAPGDVKSVNRG